MNSVFLRVYPRVSMALNPSHILKHKIYATVAECRDMPFADDIFEQITALGNACIALIEERDTLRERVRILERIVAVENARNKSRA